MKNNTSGLLRTDAFRAAAITAIAAAIITITGATFAADALYKHGSGAVTRWSSFENPTAAPGAGGRENLGGKGRAFSPINAGETKTLLDINGPGMITRMWCTVGDRTTDTLRSLVLRMYWDGTSEPAVQAPLGDFFGAMGHQPIKY